MGKTTFSGPIRTGVNTGRTDTTTIGTVILTQNTTVVASTQRTTAASKQIVLPPNSDLVDIIVRTAKAWPGGGGATFGQVHIGDAAVPAAIAKVSCANSGVYRMGGTNFTLPLQNLHQISPATSTKTIFVKTSATAADPGESVVTIIYAQRP